MQKATNWWHFASIWLMKKKGWDYSFKNGLTPWREGANVDEVLRIPRISGGNALDLGCGTGEWAIALAKKGFEVEGLDFSSEALRIAQSLPNAQKVTWAKWDLEKLAQYPFKHALYDIVIDHKVLSFIQEKENYLEAVKFILSGVYILTVFHEHDKKGAIVILKDEFNRLILPRFKVLDSTVTKPRPGKVLATYYLTSLSR